MRTHKWSSVQTRRFKRSEIEASRKRAMAEVLEMNLRALRERRGKTQAEIARLVAMTQGELSRAERRTDHLVSTLRKVVEAMGGELEIVATFDGERIRLSGI